VIVGFEDLELDLSRVELRRSGVRVPVEPQVFEVLAYLVNHRDRVVPKEELMDKIWGGRFVSEAAVTSRIKQARQAIGDNGQAQRLMNSLIDVRAALGTVRVPTLVMHRRGDQDSSVEEGRYLAEHIPGAQFVELSGANHFVAIDANQSLDQVERFLADLESVPATRRALGAVLAVAGPVNVAGRLFAGRAARTPDGQTVIVYDGPAAAIRDALSSLSGPQGRAIRFGLQIAEVPRTGSVVDGPGVEAALGLAQRAAPGQLLVSPAVRDLVADSGLSFVPAGQDAYRPAEPTLAPS
jgi:hypothetical protein